MFGPEIVFTCTTQRQMNIHSTQLILIFVPGLPLHLGSPVSRCLSSSSTLPCLLCCPLSALISVTFILNASFRLRFGLPLMFSLAQLYVHIINVVENCTDVIIYLSP